MLKGRLRCSPSQMEMDVMASRNECGDTLIEVLVAMGILAIVVVGIFSAMNKAIQLSYGALERSVVRSEINRQIEVMYFLRDDYFDKLINDPSDAASTAWHTVVKNNTSDLPDVASCTPTSGAYTVSKVANTWRLESYPAMPGGDATANGLPSPGEGIWIESKYSSGSGVPYTDVNIKACWQASNGTDIERLSTVMRFYDK